MNSMTVSQNTLNSGKTERLDMIQESETQVLLNPYCIIQVTDTQDWKIRI